LPFLYLEEHFAIAMERRSSWESAKIICVKEQKSSLPQFTEIQVEQIFRNLSSDSQNFTVWLGLRKTPFNKNDCTRIDVENDTKLTDFTLDRCYSVNCLNITKKKMQTPCDEPQHPLCIQRKISPTGTVF
jgi:exonuclease III